MVPLEGKPGHLRPMANLPVILSNEVVITPEVSPTLSAYFNRGLISTQRVSRAFKGKPSKGKLLPRIQDEGDALRASLSGDMVEAVTEFTARAKKSGRIYAALYELGDEQLIVALESLGKRLDIVLSNSVVTNEKTKKKTDGNEDARNRLKATARTVWDRIMPSNHIGHNKFLVHVASGKAKSVLFGSTNWTSNGLCAQTNNTLVVNDPKLADRYWGYWKELAAETEAAKGLAKNLHTAKLRGLNAAGKSFDLGSATAQSWFSPNTPKARGKKTASEKHPPDMAALIERMNKAKHAVLFLAFYPGAPCVADWAADALKKDKNLFVRGCVTNNSASEGFYYQLRGMTPPKRVKGQKKPIKQDPRVFAAEALGDNVPDGWTKEILKAGFAIIHDKIVVIDPFSDQCVVATGSHNLGHKASFNNDENMAIIVGDKELACAYATHVLDVYDHFAWRYLVNRLGKKADQSLASKPEEWLGKYFDASGKIKTAQLKFWMQATS